MYLGLAFTWVVVLLLGWLGWQLLRQNGRLLLRLEALEKRLDETESGGEPREGLPVGSAAPQFDLPDLSGERRTLAQFRGQPVLLIFFNPECGFCREMAPQLAALHIDGDSPADGRPRVLILSTGDAAKNRQFFSEYKITCPVLLQKEAEVSAAYQAAGTPTGYFLNARGEIASELALGAQAVLALASGSPPAQPPSQDTSDGDRASRLGRSPSAFRKNTRNGLKAGTPAPDFRLPRLDGGELALADLRGRRVLLVFSDPQCGPCAALAPQLERCHQEHPEIQVVMISRGMPEENRAKIKELGLTFPVVLQRHWEISRSYNMYATPIAYLIDEAGVIKNDVAVGEDAILRLLTEAGQVNEALRH